MNNLKDEDLVKDENGKIIGILAKGQFIDKKYSHLVDVGLSKYSDLMVSEEQWLQSESEEG